MLLPAPCSQRIMSLRKSFAAGRGDFSLDRFLLHGRIVMDHFLQAVIEADHFTLEQPLNAGVTM